jgi:hypothetical protein
MFFDLYTNFPGSYLHGMMAALLLVFLSYMGQKQIGEAAAYEGVTTLPAYLCKQYDGRYPRTDLRCPAHATVFLPHHPCPCAVYQSKGIGCHRIHRPPDALLHGHLNTTTPPEPLAVRRGVSFHDMYGIVAAEILTIRR